MPDRSEEWKTVQGLVKYAVSNKGRVMRLAPGKRARAGYILRPYPSNLGYLLLSLYDSDGKRVDVRVHQVVARAFIGECPIGLEINHIDGDKSNNRTENLEYVSRRENILHSIRTGLKHYDDAWRESIRRGRRQQILRDKRLKEACNHAVV